MHEIDLVHLHKRVFDYWIPGIGWKWEILEDLLSLNILSKLTSFTLMEEDDAIDDI